MPAGYFHCKQNANAIPKTPADFCTDFLALNYVMITFGYKGHWESGK